MAIIIYHHFSISSIGGRKNFWKIEKKNPFLSPSFIHSAKSIVWQRTRALPPEVGEGRRAKNI